MKFVTRMITIEDIDKLYFEEVISCLGYHFSQLGITSISSSGEYDIEVNFGIEGIGNDINFKPNKNTFVHFTSLKALISILSEKSIRLYNINGTNDKSDVSHYAKLFKLDDSIIQNYKDEVYIMSNCCSTILNSDDELTLWRLYGNDGYGCCIEFEYIEDPFATNTHRYNINYVNNETERLNLFFSKHNEFNNKYKPFNINADKFILDLAVFHKSTHYKIEKEQRIFQRVYKTLNHNNIFFDFNSKNTLTSYIKIPLDYSENKEILEKQEITPRIKIKKIIFGHKNLSNKLNENEELEFYSKFFKSQSDLPKIEYSKLINYN